MYLCGVKRIGYISPIEYVSGNISGRQVLDYDGGAAYDIATGSRKSADDYEPRVIACVRDLYGKHQIKYFVVRTRTTVNMTARMRNNLALMGGVGALFAALLSDKTAQIYVDCLTSCPVNMTLRQFVTPKLRAGLAAKMDTITIAEGVTITNPWVHTGTQTLTISPDIINKFNSELS